MNAQQALAPFRDQETALLMQGVLVPLTHRLRHQRTVHLELSPSEG